MKMDNIVREKIYLQEDTTVYKKTLGGERFYFDGEFVDRIRMENPNETLAGSITFLLSGYYLVSEASLSGDGGNPYYALTKDNFNSYTTSTSLCIHFKKISHGERLFKRQENNPLIEYYREKCGACKKIKYENKQGGYFCPACQPI